MRKKKKDELEPKDSENISNTQKVSPGSTPFKITALEEKETKFATKPNSNIEQFKIKSTFSLNEIKDYPKLNQQIKVTVEDAPLVNTLNRDVTVEEIITAIKNYGAEKQKQGSRQLATIFSTSHISFADNTITLTINNETQKEQLLSIKQSFIDTIRQDLLNNLICLEIKTSVNETQSKAYKPIDVYKVMAEKNPALSELKKRFDLEIDY